MHTLKKKEDGKNPRDRIKLVCRRITKEASVAEASRREGIREERNRDKEEERYK